MASVISRKTVRRSRAEHVGYTAEMVARVIEETATMHTIEDGWAGRDGQTVG